MSKACVVIYIPQTYQTNRLILRPFIREDSPSIFDYARNPNVSRYTAWKCHKTLCDSKGFVDKFLQAYDEKSLGPLAICLKSSPNKVIGTIHIKQGNHQFEGELSYALSETYWRQGIVSEAVRCILKVGFEERGLGRIFARCAVENNPSKNFLKRLGFSYEGCLRRGSFNKGRFWDVEYYSVLYEEWKML